MVNTFFFFFMKKKKKYQRDLLLSDKESQKLADRRLDRM